MQYIIHQLLQTQLFKTKGAIINQCDHASALSVKMFDSQTVPKYIIGKDYKITPVSPATIDVLINRCSLAAEDVSQ